MTNHDPSATPSTPAGVPDASGDVPVESLAGRGPRVSARALPRRTVLRGAGVAVALPWLEAMAGASPAASAQDGPSGATTEAGPRRLAYVYAPNGVHTGLWRGEVPVDDRGHPAPGRAPIADLPPLLEGLGRWRGSMQILRGLAQHCARANGDGPGDHARAAAVFLTGVQPLKTEGRVRLGVSADQVAAQTVGGATRVRSLVLGTETGRQSGQCDSGYSCAYSGHVSWESATVPAAKQTDPRRAFDDLFRGGAASVPREERERTTRRRRSLLDFVRSESKALSKRLSTRDRARIDEFETGLFELERQLSFDGAAHVDAVGEEARPGSRAATFAEHAELLGDVLALAFETDQTRIATLMYGNEGSNRRYTEVEVKEGHHSLSHHRGEPAKLEAIERINRLHLASLDRLLERLSTAEGEDGHSVLDATMLVYGSGIAEGNRHDHHDLPILLFGGAATGLEGGHRLCFARNTPANDLHLALLQRMRVEVEGLRLGDGRGPLAI